MSCPDANQAIQESVADGGVEADGVNVGFFVFLEDEFAELFPHAVDFNLVGGKRNHNGFSAPLESVKAKFGVIFGGEIRVCRECGQFDYLRPSGPLKSRMGKPKNCQALC